MSDKKGKSRLYAPNKNGKSKKRSKPGATRFAMPLDDSRIYSPANMKKEREQNAALHGGKAPQKSTTASNNESQNKQKNKKNQKPRFVTEKPISASTRFVMPLDEKRIYRVDNKDTTENYDFPENNPIPKTPKKPVKKTPDNIKPLPEKKKQPSDKAYTNKQQVSKQTVKKAPVTKFAVQKTESFNDTSKKQVKEPVQQKNPAPKKPAPKKTAPVKPTAKKPTPIKTVSEKPIKAPKTVEKKVAPKVHLAENRSVQQNVERKPINERRPAQKREPAPTKKPAVEQKPAVHKRPQPKTTKRPYLVGSPEAVEAARKKHESSERRRYIISLTAACLGALTCVLLLLMYIFSIKSITVVGADAEYIQELANIKKGDNLLLKDVNAIASALNADPYIEVEAIRKKYPSGLIIIVNEKHECAYIEMGDWCAIIDDDGTVLSMIKKEDVDTSVMKITGMSTSGLKLGTRLSDTKDYRTRTLLKLITAIKDANNLEISEINIANPFGIYLKTQDGIDVYLGDDSDLGPKLAVIVRECNRLLSLGYGSGTLDISDLNSIIYRKYGAEIRDPEEPKTDAPVTDAPQTDAPSTDMPVTPEPTDDLSDPDDTSAPNDTEPSTQTP